MDKNKRPADYYTSPLTQQELIDILNNLSGEENDPFHSDGKF